MQFRQLQGMRERLQVGYQAALIKYYKRVIYT